MTALIENETIPLAGIACETQTGITTLPLSKEPSFAYWQQDIPAEYWDLDAKTLVERVRVARQKLGTRLIVLGHHYQREDIIQFADIRGDSFKLAQWAAQHPESEYIVFCGVHFMAEAAGIPTAPPQKGILPKMAAGRPRAGMADPEDVYACWEELEEAGLADKVVPVTYMNSAASLKAFCGRHGGIVCTSSNAAAVLRWAFERGEKALFFPDQHLGRNSGAKMGIPLDVMPLWNYNRPYGSLGGNTLEELERAKVILWQGHCSLPQRFTPAPINAPPARGPPAPARPTRTRTSPSSASTPSSAPARRCTASTPPTSAGRLSSWPPAGSSTAFRWTTRRRSTPRSPSTACWRSCEQEAGVQRRSASARGV